MENFIAEKTRNKDTQNIAVRSGSFNHKSRPASGYLVPKNHRNRLDET
ncbi:MAG: hypothetical protein ACKN9S_06985 [Pirellula sp.]|jgi:hypothetical protein